MHPGGSPLSEGHPTPQQVEAPAPAEEVLRAAHTYAESIFETAREPLLLLDEQLRVRAANRAFFEQFHVSPAETEGRRLYDLGDGQWDVPRLRLLLEEIIPHDGRLDNFEVQYDIPQLGRRTLLLNARRVCPAAGRGQGICLSIEDVTEKRQAREDRRRLHEELEERVRRRTAELEAANQELEAFSYSVAHDLRSPLRAMEGYARILVEEHAPALPPAVSEYVRDIRRNAVMMGLLIDDLLAFSRLSRQPLQKRLVAPGPIVRQVLEELRGEREGRSVETVVGELPPCYADPSLLKQVWSNLLGNALKYTRKRDQARVEVGSRKQDGEQVYFVRDDGVGFDMRYAAKLFGVFQRLHRAADFEGTGVGLAIVKRVVQRHGGRVWAEAAVNQGATFSFTLPPEGRP